MLIKNLDEIQSNRYLSKETLAFLEFNHIDPDEFTVNFPDYGREFITIENYIRLMSQLNYSEEFLKYVISNRNKKFIIIGDYDADGTMGTTILVEVFREIGIKTDFIIPERLIDGYGIKKEHIDKAKELDGDIIITVDNGISSCDVIDYANSLGFEVIITDHHQPQEKLPNAKMIIDPWLNNDEYQSICGAAVAMKLVLPLTELIFDKGEKRNIINEIIVFAAIATIADMMPLLGENRILINAALNYINFLKQKKFWFGRILKVISGFGPKFDDENVTEDTIKFYIAPTINSVSRMGGDMNELINKILNCNQQNIYINGYYQYNNERKDLVKKMVKTVTDNKEIGNMIIFNPNEYDKPIKGVCGLVANKLISETEKVSLVGMKNDNIVDMSGRSIKGYSIYDGFLRLQKKFPELNISGGGHSAAIGLRFIPRDDKDIEMFKESFLLDIQENLKEYETTYFEVHPDYIDRLAEEKLRFKIFGQEFENLKLFFSGNVLEVCDKQIAKIEIYGREFYFKSFVNLEVGSKITGLCSILTIDNSYLLKIEKVFNNEQISESDTEC